MDLDHVIDADNHYYETDDCFTRHIEARFRDKAINIRRGDDGLGKIYKGDERIAFMSVTPQDYVLEPASFRPWLEGRMARDELELEPIPCDPAYQDRDKRLARMDEQNIDAMVLYPTLAVTVEHELHDDPDASYANLRAFNRWLEDDWGYSYQDRIFAVPLLSLLDIDQAVTELDRVIEAGARAVHLKAGPVYGRSPADAHYDPFWARCAEAGVPVAFHAGDAGYNELITTLWGEPGRPPSRKMSPFQMFLSFHRPIIDTLACLVLQNLFGRFPDLAVMSIEQGSEWVPGLLHELDWTHGRRRELEAAPSEVFRRHVSVAPFHEENIGELVETIGSERVLFGSDYPHPEGLAPPRDFLSSLEALPADAQRRIVHDNIAGLLQLV